MDAIVQPPASESLAAIRASLRRDKLPMTQIFQIGERIMALRDQADSVGVPVKRVAVAGALTIEYLARAIACAVVLEGEFPIVHIAPFGAYTQEIMDPSSALHRFGADVVVLAPDWRELIEDLPNDAPAAQVQDAIANQIGMFSHLWRVLAERRARVIQHTLVPPKARFRGAADRITAASVRGQIDALNAGLMQAGAGRIAWIETDRIGERAGLNDFLGERYYFAGKLPFDLCYLPDYLLAARGAWRALMGRSKKVLAVDLDNTLWGGVIGDDGVDGIRLGPAHGAEGEAFEAWQAYIKALAQRGVILAACSKNDPAIATTGLTHAHSRLTMDDFAAFECSWSDKMGGLQRIAAALNVGIDSIVFVDDNPAEIALIKEQLPAVEAIHLGDDPVEFIERLDHGNWFDLLAYTAEDAGRGEMYRARREAEAARAQAGSDMGSYLKGLKMVGRVYRPEPGDMARVAQMEGKTNQFNVTTRRFTEADIDGFMCNENAVVLAFRLKDRFGDHGLTSTLFAVREGDRLRIDSWLMSCRIFSRSAEQLMMRHLVAVARDMGVATIVGEYLPTPRNVVVADLFGQRLGFDAADAEGRFWTRDVAKGEEDLVTFIAEAG
jgi:FkbH-like protein